MKYLTNEDRIDIITYKFQHDVSNEDIAEKLKISPSYFSLIFWGKRAIPRKIYFQLRKMKALKRA